ncbi:MAG: hypothetical protein EXQ89_07110 [Rhodospirillaceae bacterium]|nr:hypothetical protein [Rhodospirillaceae bacterium]
MTLALSSVVFPAARAQEAASAWVNTEHTNARLIAAARAVGVDDAMRLGLQFRMKPGWKIYWRSPGDAGYPPSVDWTGSANLANAALRWPAPFRFKILGLDTYGYEGEVVLPITATIAEPGRPLNLKASVDYLTCKEICVPYKAVLALRLPSGIPQATEFAHLIDRFSVRVPGEGGAHGVHIESVEALSEGKDEVLRVVARSLTPFNTPDLFVEGPGDWSFAAPETRLAEGGLVAELRVLVRPERSQPGTIVGSAIVLTLADGERAAERSVTVAAGTAPMDDTSIAAMIVLLATALLGGLILNLMPCVLPVLSMKLLSVVGHGGGDRRHVRLSFLASAAGILTSFLLLATALAGLKQAGVAVGWGMQFQQPLFLAAMVLIVALFAANLWGLFEINLPAAVGDVAARAGTGRSLAGSFLSGALATILATPCSAPFVGTALGFALARGTFEIFAVFAALGLGLALPYLLVALRPSWVTRLPRPGNWMVGLRRLLGFAMAGTAIWLLSVLTAQTGALAALVVGGLAAATAALPGVANLLSARLRPLAPVAMVLFAALALWVPSRSPETVAELPLAAKGDWRVFDRGAIAELVAAGNIVFVDVMADWCITCKVNKSVVIDRGDVAARLGGERVIRMRADWTRPNDAIAAYLASFGRYGIPLNVVYGPGARNGLALPELLTVDAVLSALDKAGS